MEEVPTLCPNCKNIISQIDISCPKCGKKVKDTSLTTGIQKQFFLYFLSFFLPYFAIWPAIKYLRQPNPTSKKVGVVAIILIITSLLLSVYFTKTLLNSLNSKLDYYRGLN
ncbi:hypothetical protein HY382_02980 [Candidatus Curtissbacteria bacterium]|nr:hypothetical protein [Candidatus Curtissbacteria bacterium]